MDFRQFLLRTRLAFEEAKAVTRCAMNTDYQAAGPEVAQLENRVLLSASPAPVAIDTNAAGTDGDPGSSWDAPAELSTDPGANLMADQHSTAVEPSCDMRSIDDAVDLLDELGKLLTSQSDETSFIAGGSASDVQAAEFQNSRHELALIDSQLPNFERLIDDLQAQADAGRNLQIVVMPWAENGWEFLSRVMPQQNQELDAVHIFSHGGDGLVLLGATPLTDVTLATQSDLFLNWSAVVAEDADLLLYGCGVAATETGQSFVSQLAQLTGMDVAASVDTTGHTALGGNWELEYVTGQIDTPLAPSSSFRDHWMAILPTYEQFATYTDDAAICSSVNWGQTFRHNSGAGQYSINQLSLAMFRANDAAVQNITATLRTDWDGSVLATATVASDSLSTGYAWVDFDFEAVQLTDDQSYTIRITSSADDGKVFLGYAANGYPNGTLIDKDGVTLSDSDLAFKVSNVNTAPVLDNTKSPILSAQNEDSDAPSGAVGTLVSSLVDFSNPPGQVDNVTDTDPGSVLGIAVTAVDTTNGTWYYSTDGGTNWLDLGAVNTNSARLLAADTNTRLYFQPNANFHGTLANAITFHAWDQTSGTSGSLTDTSSNGGTTAFSSATDTASLTINAVNDAPVLDSTKSPAMATQLEDSGTPSGAVGTLISSLVDFQVPSGQMDNISDVDTGAQLGIAVTAADTTHGSWYYSTNDGSTWNAMGSVSDTNARLLAADTTTRLYFQPNANYNGTLANVLTLRAWDGTSGSNGGTGDTSSNGGTTAFSTTTDTISVTVNAVNDAPTRTDGDVNHLTVLENSGLTSLGLSSLTYGPGGDLDESGQTLVYRVTAVPSATLGNVVLADGVTVVTADVDYTLTELRSMQFQTAADVVGGPLAFQWTVQDNGGKANGGTDTLTETLNLTVTNFIVTNTNDFGTGSLRQQIIDSNNVVGVNTITFNLAEAGVQTIQPTSALPTITDAVVIDGYTQPGSSPNSLPVGSNATLLIVLSGANLTGNAHGLNITSGGSTVRGLVINDFTYAGIALNSGNNNIIAGNFIGTNAAGTAAVPNGRGTGWDGIVIGDVGTSSNNVIGGNTPADRNVISGNSGAGIRMSASDGGNTIRGNYIGVNAAGTAAIGNTNNGIRLASHNNTVGGTLAGQGNTVANNTGPGVVVISGYSGNAILGNLIYSNTGIGIDSANNGVSANDGTKSTSQANSGMDFPLFTMAVLSGNTLSVDGFVGSAPGQTTFASARIEIYKSDGDSTGFGEGQVFLGFLTADANGNFTGSLDVSGQGLNAGDRITATATDESNNTSEFGLSIAVGNAAPTLASCVDLPTIDEDSASHQGILVSTLITGQITDADPNALTGIAVTAVDNSNGTWQYSTNGGSNWSNFGSASAASSRLLASDASTYVRFVPNANWNGTLTNGITFRAWDQTEGAAGSTANTNANDGNTAFSTTTASASITVTAVNDAPVASGSATLAAIDEDTTSPAGATVNALFGGNFSDATDQIVGGSTANTFAGIAISNYTVNASKGQWQYSTNLGVDWTTLRSTTTTTALTLNTTDLLRFVPITNYNGLATTLAARLIESDQVIAGGATLDLTGATGGITRISSGTVTLGETINPVNDAPVLDTNKTPALATQSEDSGPPAGAVGTLVSSLVDFASPAGQVDNVTEVDSGALLGIAITAADTANGNWYYSTNGGTNWNALGAVANNNARLLVADANTRIHFEPNANYYGTLTGVLTFRAWDRTSGSNGILTDTTTNGGISAFSFATDTASLTINPVADTPSATHATTNEDTQTTSGLVVSRNVVDGGEVTHLKITGITNGTLYKNDGVTQITNGTMITFAEGNAGLKFTPTANFFGSGSFTVQASISNGDAGLGGGTATATITVTPVNDAPVANNDMPFNSLVLINQPVGYWRLGESSGPTAVNLGSSGINGTYSGPTLGAAGAISGDADSAADFNGLNDQVNVGTFDVAGTGLTIMGWFNADDFSTSEQRIVSKALSTGTNQEQDHWWMLSTYENGSDHVLRLHVKADGTTDTLIASSGALSAGQWYFAAATYDAASGQMKLFLNGVEVGSKTHSTGGPVSTDPTKAVVIGANPNGMKYFDGRIDEVAVYDKAIAQSQLQLLFAAGSGGYAVNEDAVLNVAAAQGVLANDNDVEGDPLTAVLVDGPSHAASFTLNANGSFIYTPTPDFHGTDSFTYRANDGTENSNLATVTLHIAAVNDAPMITSDGGGNAASLSIAENSTATTTITATDIDVPAQMLSYSIVGGADAAMFTIDSGSGELRFLSGRDRESHSDADSNGTYEVIVNASDGSLSDTQAIRVTITDVDEFDAGPVTDTHVAANTVAENAAIGTTVGITAAASDADATNNTITYALYDSADGQFAIHATTGVVTVNGVVDYEAATSRSVTVRATSSDGSCSMQSFTIGVTNVNETPVGVVDQYSLAQGQTLTVGSNGVLDNDWDIDGDPLTVVLQSGVTRGILVLRADGTFTYQPNPTFFGIDQFTYLATDGALATQTVTVTLMVNDSLPQPDTGNDWDTKDESGDSSTEDSSSDDEQDMSEGSTEGDGMTTDTPNAGPDEAALAELTADVQEMIWRAIGGRTLEQEREVAWTDSEHDRNDSAALVASLATLPRTRATLNSGLIATLRSEGLDYETSRHSLTLSTLPLTLESTSMPKERMNQAPGLSAESLVLGTSAVVSSALTVGYVTWLLRGGSLLTSLLASLPAWASFDPLPVLMSGTQQDDEDENEDRLVDLVRGEETSRSVNSATPVDELATRSVH